MAELQNYKYKKPADYNSPSLEIRGGVDIVLRFVTKTRTALVFYKSDIGINNIEPCVICINLMIEFYIGSTLFGKPRIFVYNGMPYMDTSSVHGISIMFSVLC